MANEQMIKFWWRSGSLIWIRNWIWMNRISICISTLVRRALAEVFTVQVLLVCFIIVALWNRADHYIFCHPVVCSSFFYFLA